MSVSEQPLRLLIAASGTGGHLFPAMATAQVLTEYEIEWLGVPNRLETQLIPPLYQLHTIPVEGLQKKLGLGYFKLIFKLIKSIFLARNLLKNGKFQSVFTTGGYVSAPTIIAAKSLKIPVILHESNALPGKVTRWLGPWCDQVAIGFAVTTSRLPGSHTVVTGTPVRSEFLTPQSLELPIPPTVPLIVVMGGSQGALTINQLVRKCALKWLEIGAWIVHLTGNQDPEFDQFQHPHYIALPFYDKMGALLQRANLAISRSGASALTELAVTKTPAILIPFPFAAEDHQRINAEVLTSVGGGICFAQDQLTPSLLESEVLRLLENPELLRDMGESAFQLAVLNSTELLANIVRQFH